ncbi:enoyl-CoA hydratase/isomerase family protein [Gordonia sp. HY002]|uniref:enoyl-CoA hydratase/isomerase family protein n=1 Tax=Gordonia zhenghanii TaxID=2911516 RepID=UPI001EF04292|nr:enoyl-CoA hydratase/isomerase family protein [Gordonia zhenghanii]MCF8570528.1 enoyl-CoA hydratase/isomerase family protein [Gordonia zhenghanii]MCF8602515.1 enoyl-CoA hydratase/isomerase family protein [Gordonia zhenghanii]
MPYLNVTDDAAELYLGAQGSELDEANPENRFQLEWIEQVTALVDEAIAARKPLIVSATGKFFTNGLDTDFVFANGDKLPSYLDTVHQLYVKFLTVPAPVIVAINGHAFGAGAMLALCADYRIMRSDRGFFSLPEAALNMPFTRGMAALVRTRTPDATATEAMLTSRRYGGDDAVSAGIAEEAVAADALLERAREVARERTPLVGDNQATIKRGLRLPLLEDLNTPTPATLL